MCDKIIEQGTHQPVICFTSEDDALFRDYLEKLVTQQLKSVPFLYVDNHDQAIEQMHASNELTTGVYVLHRDYARGYDIKFGKDAFVAILSENSSIRGSEVRQMIGRGSRTQGIQIGAVFLTGQTSVTETNIRFIDAKDQVRYNDIGPEIATAIIKLWSSLTAAEKGICQEKFREMNFR